MTRLRHLVIGTPQGASADLRKESRFIFNYTATDKRCELSLAMPIRAESYSSGGLPPIFEMNRPEGYDVVTTSIYGSTSLHTGITKYDRTLALNLAKSKNYPDRATLLDFGARVRGMTRPAQVLERIAEAMRATLSQLVDRIDGRLLAQMRTEWEVGISLASTRSGPAAH